MSDIKLVDFQKLLYEQWENGSIYVWASVGTHSSKITTNTIKSHELRCKNGASTDRAIAGWKARKALPGEFRAFDCSGLGRWCLQQLGSTFANGHNSTSMYKNLCTPISLEEVKSGDWVFRGSNSNPSSIGHVGYVVDNDLTVIECMGRNKGVGKGGAMAGAGVTKTNLLDSNGKSRWDFYGRPEIFKEQIGLEFHTQQKFWLYDFRGECLTYWALPPENLEEEDGLEQDAVGDDSDELPDALEVADSSETVDKHFFDHGADLRWLTDTGLTMLDTELSSDGNVIILLGYNDCINTCIAGTDITEAAKSYSTAINNYISKVKADGKAPNIYFCSVIPVTGNIPNASFPGGLISKDELNNIIRQFNNTIQTTCNAKFVDIAGYLERTSFHTIDNVHYTKETCQDIQCYLNATIFNRTSASALYTPRYTAPIINSEYFINKNPFGSDNKNNKYGMPNSSAYAIGRAAELAHSFEDFPDDYASDPDPGKWFEKYVSGPLKGQDLKLGAIMCWKGNRADANGYTGHAAVIERIEKDENFTINTIYTSESIWYGHNVSYNPNYSACWKISDEDNETLVPLEATPSPTGQLHFKVVKRTLSAAGTWNYTDISSGIYYTFVGCLYSPVVFSDSATCDITDPIPNSATDDLINCYLNESREKEDEARKANARYIWQYLGSAKTPWTLNAVAALLGNAENECQLNHTLWESRSRKHFNPFLVFDSNYNLTTDPVQREQLTSKGGFGLLQWTGRAPDGVNHKFIKWCQDNKLNPGKLDSQLKRIVWEVENDKQYATRERTTSFTFELDDGSTETYCPAQGIQTFKEFIQSDRTPAYLAAAFVFHYERPASVASDTPVSTTLKVLKQRGDQAINWYKYLQNFSPVKVPFSFTELKLDRCDSTTADFTFLLNSCSKCSYTLSIMDSKNKDNKTIIVGPEELQIENSVINSLNLQDLIPSTNYELEIVAEGNDLNSVVTKQINFVTKQSYPDIFTNVKLNPDKNNYKLPNQNFVLSYEQPKNWGYWYNNNSNTRGYRIHLFINSQKVLSKEMEVNEKVSLTFNPNADPTFLEKAHMITPGKTLQIGLEPWVNDDSKKPVYGELAVSNDICLLEQPYTLFISNGLDN